MNTVKSTSSPPPSVADYRVNVLCMLLFFVAMFFLSKFFGRMSASQVTILCLLTAVVPLWLYDFLYSKVHHRPSTGLHMKPDEIDKKRVAIKLIGLFGTYLIILLCYCFIPMYRAPFYAPFFYFLKFLAAAILALSFFYFREVDRRQHDPYDTYWHVGCLLTGRFKEVNPVFLKEHARVWFIKSFFTPFIFAMLAEYVRYLSSFNWNVPVLHFVDIYHYFFSMFFTIDLIYGVLGYILTFRILDTHIRSTEPTFLGWIVCIACYAPFYSFLNNIGLFDYNDGVSWFNWLASYPWLYYPVGGLVLALMLIYCLATVAIGYRMSNLTFRGIITSGPYRYTKHPAYLSKVASWWLISLPFLSFSGPAISVKHTLSLCFLTFIYYLRARTEENHLSNYPEYVEYANWIREHGLFSFITKRFPKWQYSDEKAKRWNSVVWFKKLG